MPATGDNKRRIAREYARRNQQKTSARMREVQPSGLNKWQEYVRSRPEVILFHNAKRRARLRGVPFTISPEDIQLLISGMTCAIPFCRSPLVIGNRKQGNKSPTLDEVIIGLGYVKGNVAIVCHDCNRRKSDSTSQQLRQLAEWIDTYGGK